MTIIDRGAKPRGKAIPFDVAKVGAPPLPSEHFEVFDVTSAPKSWAQSARHYDLRPGDRALVDWSFPPEQGVLGAIRIDSGVRFALFDGEASAKTGRLVNPSRLLRVPAP